MGWAPDPVGMAYALSIFILLSSTTDSMKEFSNKAQFTIIYVVSVIGFSLSVADFVLLATRELHVFSGSRLKNGDGNKALGIELLVPAWVKLH